MSSNGEVVPTAELARCDAQAGSHGGKFASAYLRLVKCCQSGLLDPRELTPLVSAYWARQPLFHGGFAATERLGKVIGASGDAWACALGSDLVGTLTPRLLLVSGLRYCPRCLEDGWHTAMFQHVGVGACPLHRVRLRMGCPHCGQPIATSPSAIGEHHHYCVHCGRPLGAFGTASPAEYASQACFADLHQAICVPASRDFVAGNFAMDACADHTVSEAGTSLALARHRIWPTRPLTSVRSVTQEAVGGYLSPIECPADLQARSWIGTIDALKEIDECLKANGCSTRTPWELTVSALGGRRIDGRAWLASAAWWRTAVALGAQRYCRDYAEPRFVPANAHPFQYWMPRVAAAAEQVARRQVYALFALNLLDLRKYRLLRDLPWGDLPPAVAFSPPWRLREWSGRWEIQMRVRVSFGLLERLIKRHRKRRLETV